MGTQVVENPQLRRHAFTAVICAIFGLILAQGWGNKTGAHPAILAITAAIGLTIFLVGLRVCVSSWPH